MNYLISRPLTNKYVSHVQVANHIKTFKCKCYTCLSVSSRGHATTTILPLFNQIEILILTIINIDEDKPDGQDYQISK